MYSSVCILLNGRPGVQAMLVRIIILIQYLYKKVPTYNESLRGRDIGHVAKITI